MIYTFARNNCTNLIAIADYDLTSSFGNILRQGLIGTTDLFRINLQTELARPVVLANAGFDSVQPI